MESANSERVTLRLKDEEADYYLAMNIAYEEGLKEKARKEAEEEDCELAKFLATEADRELAELFAAEEAKAEKARR